MENYVNQGLKDQVNKSRTQKRLENPSVELIFPKYEQLKQVLVMKNNEFSLIMSGEVIIPKDKNVFAKID